MHEHLKDLTDHLDWADAGLWRAVLAKEGAAEDERLLFLLHHIHLVQHAFLSVWTEQPLDPLPELAGFDGPRAVAAWGRGRIEGVRTYLAEASPEELERELDFPWAADLEKRFNRPLGPVQLQQSALQVALHSLHHRAQAATRLRELGGEPPPLDFIIWLWHDRPAAQWPVGTGPQPG